MKFHTSEGSKNLQMIIPHPRSQYLCIRLSMNNKLAAWPFNHVSACAVGLPTLIQVKECGLVLNLQHIEAWSCLSSWVTVCCGIPGLICPSGRHTLDQHIIASKHGCRCYWEAGFADCTWDYFRARMSHFWTYLVALGHIWIASESYLEGQPCIKTCQGRHKNKWNQFSKKIRFENKIKIVF